jgi:hypothetical protein
VPNRCGRLPMPSAKLMGRKIYHIKTLDFDRPCDLFELIGRLISRELSQMVWICVSVAFAACCILAGRLHSYHLDRMDELHAGGIFRQRFTRPQ